MPDEMPEETFCQIFSYDAEGRLAVITHIFPPAECTGHYFGDEDAVSSDGLSAEDVDCLLSGEDEPAEREEAGRLGEDWGQAGVSRSDMLHHSFVIVVCFLVFRGISGVRTSLTGSDRLVAVVVN